MLLCFCFCFEGVCSTSGCIEGQTGPQGGVQAHVPLTPFHTPDLISPFYS